MRALRRAALALGLASLAAAIVRLRGRGGRPTTVSTWQEVPVERPAGAGDPGTEQPPADGATPVD